MHGAAALPGREGPAGRARRGRSGPKRHARWGASLIGPDDQVQQPPLTLVGVQPQVGDGGEP
ncbi:MAG TPA: hypothetical protein VJY65_06040, partial [Chloroflexota bacterium]|nr:hypothetical protein [Chloroflexota bacterium]